MSTHRCIIVPAVWVNLARALTDSMGPAAANMFRVPLSANGSMPASHWISAGMIDESFASVLPLTRYKTVDGADGESALKPVTDMPPPEHLAGLCAQLGVTPPPMETLSAMLSAVHVTEAESPFTEMARLGLVMASEPMDAV